MYSTEIALGTINSMHWSTLTWIKSTSVYIGYNLISVEFILCFITQFIPCVSTWLFYKSLRIFVSLKYKLLNTHILGWGRVVICQDILFIWYSCYWKYVIRFLNYFSNCIHYYLTRKIISFYESYNIFPRNYD